MASTEILKVGYNMTALTMNYVVNPFNGFFKTLFKFFEIVGYARAANELHRLGYYEEAKECILQQQRLKAEH